MTFFDRHGDVRSRTDQVTKRIRSGSAALEFVLVRCAGGESDSRLRPHERKGHVLGRGAMCRLQFVQRWAE